MVVVALRTGLGDARSDHGHQACPQNTSVCDQHVQLLEVSKNQTKLANVKKKPLTISGLLGAKTAKPFELPLTAFVRTLAGVLFAARGHTAL